MTGALVALAFVFGVLVGTLAERDQQDRLRWRNWYRDTTNRG